MCTYLEYRDSLFGRYLLNVIPIASLIVIDVLAAVEPPVILDLTTTV